MEKIMKKEGLLVEVNPQIPEPYQGFIRARNGHIGVDISSILGIPFRGLSTEQIVGPNHYVVTSKTMTKQDALNRFGINSTSDFYGLAVNDINEVGKAILHPAPGEITPQFYNPRFADRARHLVLPGFACFSTSDAQSAFAHYEGNGFGLRFKVANESDGNGQFKVDDASHLQHLLEEQRQALTEGIVLEANLHDPTTISVGYAQLGDQRYSFIAHQKNTPPNAEGQSKYLGAKVTAVRGSMEIFLSDQDMTLNDRLAVLKAVEFNRLYQQTFHPIASRLSYDVVLGLDDHGDILSGITDITGRVGGTCPALMLACMEFNQNPEITKINSEVTLNYDPTKILPEEQYSTAYVDHADLRITAKVHDLIP